MYSLQSVRFLVMGKTVLLELFKRIGSKDSPPGISIDLRQFELLKYIHEHCAYECALCWRIGTAELHIFKNL